MLIYKFSIVRNFLRCSQISLFQENISLKSSIPVKEFRSNEHAIKMPSTAQKVWSSTHSMRSSSLHYCTGHTTFVRSINHMSHSTWELISIYHRILARQRSACVEMCSLFSLRFPFVQIPYRILCLLQNNWQCHGLEWNWFACTSKKKNCTECNLPLCELLCMSKNDNW